MQHLLQSAFIEALGWSLVDSLWQTGVLWGVYCLLTANGKRRSPVFRHNLSLGLLSGATLWFALTIFSNYNNALSNSYSYSLSYFFRQSVSQEIALTWLNDVLPYVSLSYLAAFLMYSSRVFWNLSARHIADLDGHKPSADLVALLERLSEKTRITRKVALWISSVSTTPLTSGFLKPIILLPASMLTQLTPLQVEAILVHELNHIRRNDYVVNLLVLFAEAVLFFNPFAMILSSAVKRERENCCDDAVVSLGYDAWQYSQALFILGSSGHKSPDLVMAATGRGKMILLQRIKRLMRLGDHAPSIFKPVLVFFLCLAVAVVTPRMSKNSPEITAAMKEPPVVGSRSNAVLVTETKVIIDANDLAGSITAKKETKASKKRSANKKLVSVPQKDVIVSTPDDENVLYHVPVFVDRTEEIEFTFIVPQEPPSPQPVTSECPLPYVPGSTFYCPVDSLPVVTKKVIRI